VVTTIHVFSNQEWAVNEAMLAVLAVPREGGSGGMIVLLQFVAIGFIFYFLLIRPQRKEQQRHRQMIEEVKKGDEVVTAGGIIGTVVHSQDDRLTIKTGENTRIVVQRGRIAQVLTGTPTE
jgi:preprotein translocase subunit YajC